MSTRILIVEDDPDIAELVAHYLDKAGFETARAATGRDALNAIAANPPHVVILDLMLPYVDGLEICRILRSNSATAALPIIMLTARAEESERIVGLELGADDYLTKPFSPRELAVRVRNLLRRTTSRAEAEAQRIEFGDIAIDAAAREVRKGGEPLKLTLKEFDLLLFFASHPRRVFSRDQLMDRVWGYRYTGGTRTVDVHVRRLREKLPFLIQALVTVKQFGYKLADPAPALSV